MAVISYINLYCFEEFSALVLDIFLLNFILSGPNKLFLPIILCIKPRFSNLDELPTN